jgi:hypothetical protein
LEKSNCELPCWNNIIAGQTTETDLLQILDSLSIVDPRSIQNANQPWNVFDNKVYFAIYQDAATNQQSKIRGYSYSIDGIVSQLILCGEIHTSMGDIVDVIGEPENILSGGNIEDSGRLVILMNSQKGISYWYTAQKTRNSQRYEITPDVQVDCIDVFDPVLYEKLLDAKLLSGGHLNAEETLKVMYPWNGYGDLEEKYPPRQP